MKKFLSFALATLLLLRAAPLSSAYSVVFMGDSITELWWTYHQNSFFAPNSWLGKGVGGNTTAQMIARFEKDVISFNPKVVVILAGANDIARNGGYVSFEEVVANIMHMAEMSTAAGAKVAVISILPVDKFSWNLSLNPADDIRTVNSLLMQKCLERGYTWIDLYPALVTKAGGLETWITPDAVHPYDKGYEMIEQVVKPYLEELL
ncbi:MAG: acylhydrolase [Bacteroidales bacterium]|nr:acylhydrolase [Bacteroidales bacterium]